MKRLEHFQDILQRILGRGAQLAVSRKIPYPEGFKHTESKME